MISNICIIGIMDFRGKLLRKKKERTEKGIGQIALSREKRKAKKIEKRKR